MSLDSTSRELEAAGNIETNVRYPFEAPAHQTEGQVDLVRKEGSHLEHFNIADSPDDLPRTFSRLAEARKYRSPDVEGIVILEEDALKEMRHLDSVLNGSVSEEEFKERYEQPEYWSPLLHSGVVAECPDGNYSFTEGLDKLYLPEEIGFQP